MEQIDSELLERIAALAAELPDDRRRDLLELIGSWREDVRSSSREPYRELLSFTSGNLNHYGHARDVSATGLFIATDADLQVGDPLSFELTFISAPNPLRLSGEVVRITKDGVGIHFDESSRRRVCGLDEIISKHAMIMHR